MIQGTVAAQNEPAESWIVPRHVHVIEAPAIQILWQRGELLVTSRGGVFATAGIAGPLFQSARRSEVVEIIDVRDVRDDSRFLGQQQINSPNGSLKTL
jgi:hypothetical protein